MFSWAAGALGGGGTARDFAEELASNLPLPIDAKMIAVARVVQVGRVAVSALPGLTWGYGRLCPAAS